MKIDLTWILIVLTSIFSLGCKAQLEEPDSYRDDKVSLVEDSEFNVQSFRGRELYLENCSQCHGTYGQGHPEPGHAIPPVPGPLLHVSEKHSKESVAQIIETGVPDTGMYPFNEILNEDEIATIVDYLWVLGESSSAIESK